MATSKLKALWNHPAGPKTIHFWAPTFKWGISIANIADFQKPPENISYLQQIGNYYYSLLCYELQYLSNLLNYYILFNICLKLVYLAVTCTGMIWCRCSTVITPKNWNLFSVNVAMAATGIYQLTRKIK
ncbi:mitochondrial pyruvate carrier 2 isoform X1 [Capsella rubella]|uniref:mitochondrial pyruvate carrier 2 isoform X1 n=1 Tax=Capsella rubella TaxID=81985 RepID=UPI000CD557D8|nr:mitochondrial pyruvate carrier 2 isoform X1 [Capsella rubella]